VERGGERLWWETHHEDGEVVLVLRGDLDLSTEPVLRSGLEAAESARRGPLDGVLVDLGGVRFCAARGLTVLGEAATRSAAGGVRFAMRRCPGHVLRMLDILALRPALGVQDAGPSPAQR
jgi:anti-anti-sigma factor